MNLKRLGMCLTALALLACGEKGEKETGLPRASEVQTPQDQWVAYASCPDEQRPEGTGERTVRSCLTAETFHVDGPRVLDLVAEYVCAAPHARASFVFVVQSPALALGLHAIAGGKLQQTNMPEQERTYVKQLVEGYGRSLELGSRMYPLLLQHLVDAVEKEDEAQMAQHKPSAKLRQMLKLPAGCKVRRSEADSRAVVAISSEAIQRFSQLHWREATNTIARANKTADVEAAKLTIPQFVLSANTADSVARVYGTTAPSTGSYPVGFAEIDVVVDASRTSTFAVPIKNLPGPAVQFLMAQSAQIREQAGTAFARKDQRAGVTTIEVPKPESARVFPNGFWAEHVLWQVAFRNVLRNEDASLDPAQYRTYGLH